MGLGTVARPGAAQGPHGEGGGVATKGGVERIGTGDGAPSGGRQEIGSVRLAGYLFGGSRSGKGTQASRNFDRTLGRTRGGCDLRANGMLR